MVFLVLPFRGPPSLFGVLASSASLPLCLPHPLFLSTPFIYHAGLSAFSPPVRQIFEPCTPRNNTFLFGATQCAFGSFAVVGPSFNSTDCLSQALARPEGIPFPSLVCPCLQLRQFAWEGFLFFFPRLTWSKSILCLLRFLLLRSLLSSRLCRFCPRVPPTYLSHRPNS